ncbi:hypothetical protein NA56DRAFT_367103 [Hyaloscypha hepaticicola]|uniref:Uncharacterized protein n=1 Tax=Hyaloscypha hepaticicola TaxID=2082293 RepID=A0A2J6PL16_9HELO|nr:hypothetical protein NA56DRAFT_367103 [Hyaloscypha hepaticicola]
MAQRTRSTEARTQSTFASMVTNSGAFDSESTRCVKTYGGSAGIGFHGIASISANISVTRSAVASGISGIESKEDNAVILWLSNGIKNHIILYDDDKETGWLIAQTTLFLFLLQIFVMRRPGGLKVLPPELLSMPAHDGGQAAFKTLSRFKEQDHSDEDDYWEMVKETCHHLFNVSHELRQIYTDARKAYEVAPGSILGVELVDVALKEASMPVKKAKVFNPWAHLAEHQPCIVLLCKDLGQVIVPSSLDGLCSGWRSVPPGCKYLVATGPSILHMLHKRTRKEVSRLADNINWEFKDPIIGSHQTRTEIRCCHLQFLKSEVPRADRKGLLQAVQACENGGYIFTGLSKLRKFPLCRPMLAECAKIKNSAPTSRINERNRPIPIGIIDQMRPSPKEAISYVNSSMIVGTWASVVTTSRNQPPSRQLIMPSTSRLLLGFTTSQQTRPSVILRKMKAPQRDPAASPLSRRSRDVETLIHGLPRTSSSGICSIGQLQIDSSHLSCK